MSERKPCIRCERAIDSWSRLCPFCNWDQSKTPPAQPPPPPVQVAEYKPPAERSLKQYAWYGIVGVMMLVVAFGVGMLINRDGAPDKAPEPVAEQEQHVPKVKRADTPLVPVNEPGGIEQPITSAPAASAPAVAGAAPSNSQYDRTDATAVSASEYAQMAKRAQAEKKKMAVLVDPRTLTGPAFAQQPVRRRPAAQAPGAPMAGQDLPFPQAPLPVREPSRQIADEPRIERKQVMRTRAVPQYQPVPTLRARGSARFDLLIGADGRVKDINVRRSLDGNTAALIGAIQRWRFRPATENGEPVASSYSVEISFGAR
jgi:Gram-negative bacterial TonB protein C-terminal